AVAAGARAEDPEVKISEGTPSLFNDRDLVERIVPVFKVALGDENVIDSEPSMGGEDFSHYGKAGIPIHMFRLGTVESRRLARYKELGLPAPSLHSSKYYPDAEPTLRTGVVAMASAALELLQLPSDDK
ncbi:MAG: amidohydrolase, partial [Planctomycetales bacterium]|nr:amidohydrolase [Planctomycetales bacterium]